MVLVPFFFFYTTAFCTFPVFSRINIEKVFTKYQKTAQKKVQCDILCQVPLTNSLIARTIFAYWSWSNVVAPSTIPAFSFICTLRKNITRAHRPQIKTQDPFKCEKKNKTKKTLPLQSVPCCKLPEGSCDELSYCAGCSLPRVRSTPRNECKLELIRRLASS